MIALAQARDLNVFVSKSRYHRRPITAAFVFDEKPPRHRATGVAVGDLVVAVSAVFGDDVWDVKTSVYQDVLEYFSMARSRQRLQS